MSTIEHSPVIETRRLTLRAPTRADAPALARLANDFEVTKMTGRMPFPYGLDDAEAFISRCEQRDHARETQFAIEVEDEGYAGGIGFFPNEEGRVEVGYWLGRPFWGRGIATEALKGALAWAARDWRKRAVFAGHFEDNPASGVVLTKADFLYTGVVREMPSLARGTTARSRMMVWLA